MHLAVQPGSCVCHECRAQVKLAHANADLETIDWRGLAETTSDEGRRVNCRNFAKPRSVAGLLRRVKNRPNPRGMRRPKAPFDARHGSDQIRRVQLLLNTAIWVGGPSSGSDSPISIRMAV